MPWTTDSARARFARTPFRRPRSPLRTTVGEVTTIITTAVKDVAGAIGGLATDVFEIRDGVRRAQERADDTME